VWVDTGSVPGGPPDSAGCGVRRYGLRRSAADPVVAPLLAAAVRQVEADLAFVGDAEAALLADGGTTLAALMPVQDEKPLSESA